MEKPFLTLAELGEHLRAKGYPVKQKVLGHYCKPSVGLGPKPDRRFGRIRLWRPETGEAWAEAWQGMPKQRVS